MSNPASAPWPARISKNTVLTAHVTHVRGDEQWFRLIQDGKGLHWQTAHESAGGWQVANLFDPASNICDATELNRKDLSLGKGTIVRIFTEPEHVRRVLHGLVPELLVPEDGDGWSEVTRAAWPDVTEELPVEIEHTNVWATINLARVLLVTTGSETLNPVLFDRDEANFTGLPVIAESSWFSESGGAPISWDGGARLSRLYPGMLWSEAWGDLRQGAEAIQASGPVEIGEAVAEMVIADGLQFAAAWALERFDPDGRLDQQEALDWSAVAEEVTISVTLDLEPGEELPACRARLLQDPAYAAVAEALADPTSPRGQALHTRLQSVAESEVIGEVLGHALGGI